MTMTAKSAKPVKPKTKMLARKLPGNIVQCLACNRYCKIPEGNAGFCGVRANDGGQLSLTVYGKPCAVWVDPIEKKPLFHFLPGSTSYSIGTFGCNFACSFCFSPDNAVINDDSLKNLDELFESCKQRVDNEHGEIAFAGDRKTVTASGRREAIAKVFRHFYEGAVLTVKPRYAPQVTCTPEHRFFVYRNGNLEKVAAERLKEGDWLPVPKIKPKGENVMIDSKEILSRSISKIRKGRKLGESGLLMLMELKRSGRTSRQISKVLGMHPVYLRKLMGDLAHRGVNEGTFFYDNIVIEKGKRAKFKMEKGDGIPRMMRLDEDLAELLGYYCAEGHVARHPSRPTSLTIIFSYGRHEKKLVGRTAFLLERLFSVKPKIRRRRTTVTVEVSKSSLGTFFAILCGSRSKHKMVPPQIARADKDVIGAFVKSFLAGDGCVMRGIIAFNTVSKKMALGLYHLLLLLGYLPSYYEWRPPRRKRIEGRMVNQSTLYYVKLQAERFRNDFLGKLDNAPRKKSGQSIRFRETDAYWLVPIYRISQRAYSGYVYNCEVDNEHSYLVNFVGVCNCQNWDISQAPQEARVRDPLRWRDYFSRLMDQCADLPPEKIVENALASGSKSISFTYNEPTIFTEYALDTMKLAKKKGLKGVYVTNGYESRECWDAMAGLIDAANIDLKAYNQRFYTELCRVPNFELVKDSIIYAKKLGIWVEVTTLIIPDWNDKESELKAEAEFLASVDPEMPWHVTAFHPDYKLRDKPPTPPETLIRAREIGKAAGIKHIYCGNVPLAYADYETTFCHACGKGLVERAGFSVLVNRIVDGKCPFCKTPIKGVWK